MAFIVCYQENDKCIEESFSSYYLAVMRKNRLRSQGLSSEIQENTESFTPSELKIGSKYSVRDSVFFDKMSKGSSGFFKKRHNGSSKKSNKELTGERRIVKHFSHKLANEPIKRLKLSKSDKEKIDSFINFCEGLDYKNFKLEGKQ